MAGLFLGTGQLQEGIVSLSSQHMQLFTEILQLLLIMLTVKGVKGDVAGREEEGGRKGRGRKVVRKWWMRGEKKLLESRTNLVALLA